MSEVIIFGTGSMADIVHFYLTHDSPHDVVAFTAHGEYIKDTEKHGLPVMPYEELPASYPPDKYQMYIAVGYAKVNIIRAEIYEDAKSKGYKLITYVSSKCTRFGDTPIGDNCFILEDNTLQPFISVGNDVIMWSGNHIGHHSMIGDHCYITSHVVISGHCRVGAYSFLGVNATLRDAITIGESCVIGAGALIMKSTKEREVYVGEKSKPYHKPSDLINM